MSADVLRTPVSSDSSSNIHYSLTGAEAGRRSGSFEQQRRWSRGSRGSKASGLTGGAAGVLSVMKIEHTTTPRSSRPSSGTLGAGNGGSKQQQQQQVVDDVVLDIGHVEGNGGISSKRVSLVAVTPPVLPPSPPLTRVGTNDSLRVVNEEETQQQEHDLGVGGGTVDSDGDRYHQEEADTSTWAVKSCHVGDERDVEDVEDGGVDVEKADQFAAAAAADEQPDPVSVISDPLNLNGASLPPSPAHSHQQRNHSPSSSTSQPDLNSPSSTALRKQTSLARLPSLTRSHPLYRPPSPQPWDLVDPPAENNMGSTSSRKEERARRRPASGLFSLGGRQEALEEGEASGTVTRAVSRQAKSRGFKIPHSNYYYGPPPANSAYGTEPVGQIGLHHPREVVRIERDYSGGELVQFSPAYPLELEGRITPTQFIETINTINETLISAHSLRWSFVENSCAVLTFYISRLFIRSHYDREMQRLQKIVADLNLQLYNPMGLNILWPKTTAFLFLEIEYY